MGGCSECGRKGGCNSRKHEMFASVDAALARLYPTRRWGERDEEAALAAGVPFDEIEELAAESSRRLATAVIHRPGEADDWCDYLYVLCLGRTPCIAELATEAAHDGHRSVVANTAWDPTRGSPEAEPDEPADEAGDADALAEVVEATPEGVIEERYLRVALSSLGRFAGVQEVAMRLEHGDAVKAGAAASALLTESTRAGVYDPILLPRLQKLVAALAERDIVHLDFGEITEPPPAFDPADYTERFGSVPVVANYLFYARPPTTVSTRLLPVGTLSAAAVAPA